MTLLAGSAESTQDNSASEQGSVSTPATETKTWRDALPEEFRNDASLANFKNVDDLAKSFIHAQKLIGKDKVVVPTSSSTPEEWNSFYKKVGMPEPDKYAVDGLGDDEASAKLKDLFVKNNILPAQAKNIMEFLASEFSGTEEDTSGDYEAAIQAGIEDLKADWGEAFAPNLQRAVAVVDMFGGDEMKEYLRETGLGNDPNLIRLFAKIGAQFSEDSFKGTPTQTISKQDALARINALYADRQGPLLNSRDPRHADALAEVEKLSAIINS